MEFTCMVFRGIQLDHQRTFTTKKEAEKYTKHWTEIKREGALPYDVIIKSPDYGKMSL